MSESPCGSAPADPTLWSTGGLRPRHSARGPLIVTIGLAAIALIIGLVGCSRPASDKPPTTAAAPQYSEQEVADAQKAVCDAFLKASHAINVAGSRQNKDPVQKVLISLDSRLAFEAAASHLFHVLSDNPATPPQMARNVHDLASTFEEFLIARLADKPEAEVDPFAKKMNAIDSEVRKVCV